jgi:hypothetical protein
MTRVSPSRILRPLAFLAVVGLVFALTRSVGDVSAGLLLLTPALLLCLPLLAGRYVGERTLRRLARPRPERRRPPAAESVAALRPRRTVAAHGGLLLARRSAGRAPPAAAIA